MKSIEPADYDEMMEQIQREVDEAWNRQWPRLAIAKVPPFKFAQQYAQDMEEREREESKKGLSDQP